MIFAMPLVQCFLMKSAQNTHLVYLAMETLCEPYSKG